MSDELAIVATFSSGVEADVTVAILKAAGIEAYARGNDIVGIFGPGFQGSTARGVDVIVPRTELDKARMALGQEHE